MRTTTGAVGTLVVAGIAGLGLTAGALAGQERQAPPVGEIRAALRSFLDETGVPGVSVAWGRTGATIGTATAGVADPETGRPVSPDHRFHTGSIGKTFTAATVLSLVRDGTLDLDAPVRRWLGDEPWYRELPSAEDLTLRHLLSHTSGIRVGSSMAASSSRAQAVLVDPRHRR